MSLKHSIIFSLKKLIIKPLLIYTLGFLASFNLRADRIQITNIEGFNSIHFSKLGFPFLNLTYDNAIAQKPKVGFLRFGISFLKVENLRVKFDVRNADADMMLGKWNDLLEKKTLKFATIEPLSLTITKVGNDVIKIKSKSAKLNEIGELRMWDGVTFEKTSSKYLFSNLRLVYSSKEEAFLLSNGNELVQKIEISSDK
jgi:hypothetical protein